ncbi:hypothetical protein HF521_014214 [Silurus meridionalis]|uniref:Little elongation complex subunit 1 C-terminal domain-containing protein n=1 Tax=Silurus meridionalis TaxID=175797 RepID=A0A8T0AB39_SILME|nr:hypothetical protein HF521_014214 [Silurus meridionalis]
MQVHGQLKLLCGFHPPKVFISDFQLELELQLVSPPQLELELQLVSPPQLELELQLVSPPQLELELQLVSPPQLELELQLVSPPQLELELDEPPGDPYRAITSTLKALLKDKSLTFQKSSWYGDDLCPAAWDYVFSLDLLCAQLGWIWTVSHVIRKSVWLILNTWLKQTQTEETQFRNVSVAAIFRLLAWTVSPIEHMWVPPLFA